MMGAERSVVGVLDGLRDFSSRSEMVGFSVCCLGTVSYDPVASKDPCWSSFRLNGGRCSSSVIGDRPRILRD